MYDMSRKAGGRWGFSYRLVLKIDDNGIDEAKVVAMCYACS